MTDSTCLLDRSRVRLKELRWSLLARMEMRAAEVHSAVMDVKDVMDVIMAITLQYNCTASSLLPIPISSNHHQSISHRNHGYQRSAPSAL